MAFGTTKAYYNLETSLSLPGVSLLFFLCNVAGWILMYKIMPETEDCSLEDIEFHFADDSKKLTDWKIKKSKTKQEPVQELRSLH